MHRRVFDCHAHLLDPLRFPLPGRQGYKPLRHETGTLDEYCDVLSGANIAGALLVQLSSYGYDNSAILAALRISPYQFKAVVVLPDNTEPSALVALMKLGVVGVRFNLLSFDSDALQKPTTPDFLKKLRDLDLLVEVGANNMQWPAAAEVLAKAGVRILVDHFGMHSVPDSMDHPGFRAVLALGRETQAIVKLTTPYAISLAPRESERLHPFIDELLKCFGNDRCVWGSDWPFLSVHNPPKYEHTLSHLTDWISNPDTRNRILWKNPIRLFGFNEKPLGHV